MQRHLFIILVFQIFSLNSFCQICNEGKSKDSLHLDSLKSMLPGIKGSGRVDLLNTISENSIYFRGSFRLEDFARTSDSMRKYASLASEEASRLQYKFGLANALLNLRDSYSQRRPLPGDSIFARAVRDSLMVTY